MTTTKTRGSFQVSEHAIQRIVERLDIPAESAVTHVNQLMQTAIFEGRKKSNGRKAARIYFHQKSDTEIRVINSTVVTVIERKGKMNIEADFLRPVLDREIRKITRESTRQIRNIERRLAGAYRELSERMMNYANARNPITRGTIADRVEQAEKHIDELLRSIERMKDDTQTKISTIEMITK